MTVRYLRLYIVFLIVLSALFSSKVPFAAPVLKATYTATLPSGFALTVKRIRVGSDGSVYAVGTSTTAFSKVSASGDSVTSINYSVSIPVSIGADFSIASSVTSGDKFYIATNGGGNGRLLRFDVSGAFASLVASTNQSGSGAVSLLPPNNDFVYSSRATGIKRYNATLSSPSVTTNVSTTITRMSVTSDSILYYLGGLTGSFIRTTDFSSSGETTLVTGLGNTVSANSLVIAPDSSAAYIGYSTSIRKYSLPVSGSPVLLWTQSYPNSLSGMDVGSSGDIYTTLFNGTIATYWPISASTSFNAMAEENNVNLTWTNGVSGTDFSGATIRRSTVSYPPFATDGEPVTAQNMSSSFVDAHLTPNTTYYYSIFNETIDGYFGQAVTASATTQDLSPLENFSAASSGSTVNLFWTYSPSGITDSAQIQRSTVTYPASPTDGVTVCSVTAQTTCSDVGLSDGTYYYSGFASDGFGHYSAPATAIAVVNTTAPTVSTESASAITTTTATLNGTISDVGGATVTERGFEYGTTVAYGNTFSESGSFSTGPFSTSLTNLNCATTYHARAYAINTYGTSYGNDVTFITEVCPVSSFKITIEIASQDVEVGQQALYYVNIENTGNQTASDVPVDLTLSANQNLQSVLEDSTTSFSFLSSAYASSNLNCQIQSQSAQCILSSIAANNSVRLNVTSLVNSEGSLTLTVNAGENSASGGGTAVADGSPSGGCSLRGATSDKAGFSYLSLFGLNLIFSLLLILRRKTQKIESGE